MKRHNNSSVKPHKTRMCLQNAPFISYDTSKTYQQLIKVAHVESKTSNESPQSFNFLLRSYFTSRSFSPISFNIRISKQDGKYVYDLKLFYVTEDRIILNKKYVFKEYISPLNYEYLHFEFNDICKPREEDVQFKQKQPNMDPYLPIDITMKDSYFKIKDTLGTVYIGAQSVTGASLDDLARSEISTRISRSYDLWRSFDLEVKSHPISIFEACKNINQGHFDIIWEVREYLKSFYEQNSEVCDILGKEEADLFSYFGFSPLRNIATKQYILHEILKQTGHWSRLLKLEKKWKGSRRKKSIKLLETLMNFKTELVKSSELRKIFEMVDEELKHQGI